MIKKHSSKVENNNILNKYSTVDAPRTGEEDGVHYINVDIRSTTELGRRVSMVYSKPFFTIIGQASSIRMFANAITIPGFPMDLLNKFKPTKEDMMRIPKGEVSKVPNYWALVTYAFCEKVKADPVLKKLLLENNLPFTAIAGNKEVEFFNTKLLVEKPNFKLGKYIAIIRIVSEMLKTNKFTDNDIKDLIVKCKDVPEVDLLEGVACKINKAPAAKVAQPGKVLSSTIEEQRNDSAEISPSSTEVAE